ncbi:spinocerebellar ataxia type 10 protein domain-containing protein [Globomyces pollinis-pini]|nr:spinocerebellar ataxia type 10 protein domain-containing protein [Globomyces pollinis-pini]
MQSQLLQSPFEMLEILGKTTGILPPKRGVWTFLNTTVELKKHIQLTQIQPHSRLLNNNNFIFWKLISEQMACLLKSLKLENMDQISYILRLLELSRNLCAENPLNQLHCSQSNLPNLTLDILIQLINSTTNVPSSIPSIIPGTIRIGIQFLANMMTDNLQIQKLYWPIFIQSDLISSALKSLDPKTVRSTLVWIYNCTHHDTLQSSQLLAHENGIKTIIQILTICESNVDEIDNINFELGISIVTSIIELDALPIIWNSLSTADCNDSDKSGKLTLLKVLDGICHSTDKKQYQFEKIFIKTSTFLLNEMNTIINSISNSSFQLNHIEDSVMSTDSLDLKCTKQLTLQLYYILQFWNILSEEIPESYQNWLDNGLINIITKVLGALQQMQPEQITIKDSKSMDIKNHPLYMMKIYVIKIISNLTSNEKSFQNTFRISGAIGLVMSNCIIDDLNPYIREASLFCLRNLLNANIENQDLIRSLEAQAVAKSNILDELGLEAELDKSSGKVKIKRSVV